MTDAVGRFGFRVEQRDGADKREQQRGGRSDSGHDGSIAAL
jgi:hypothetical protein